MTNIAQTVLAENPFLKLLGIELESMTTGGEAVCRLQVEEKHTRIGAFLHGGVTASLIDTAMAFAVASLTGSAANAVTVDLTIHYLCAIQSGEIVAKARILRAGKRLITVSAEVFDGKGLLAATALSTYSRIQPKA